MHPGVGAGCIQFSRVSQYASHASQIPDDAISHHAPNIICKKSRGLKNVLQKLPQKVSEFLLSRQRSFKLKVMNLPTCP